MLAPTAWAEAPISSSRRSKTACTTGSSSRSLVMSTCARSMPIDDSIGLSALRRDVVHIPRKVRVITRSARPEGRLLTCSGPREADVDVVHVRLGAVHVLAPLPAGGVADGVLAHSL